MSENKNNIKLNFIFQFLYQFVLLFIPLILSPYLTRKLGDTALGVYSFVNSIAYYFVMFANLGIAKHGQRIIAKCGNDEVLKRRVFWSLFFLHSCISIFILVLYFSIFGFVDVENKNLYIIEGIYVASALFDITWLFYGLENFKSVVIKNAFIKIVECVLIFIFIKSKNDLWLYTFISASSLFLGQLVLLPKAIRLVKPIRFTKTDIIVHIKPLLVFSISVIAVSLYTVFDKTLLGWMTSKENVAYYEYANRIIGLPRTFITIIGTVLFPRACKMVTEGKFEEQKKYMKISLIVVFFIGFASLFGLLAVSKQFAVLYYGEAFSETGIVMMATCGLPLIIGLGDIIRTQYLIPNNMDKQYIICIILNAIINLVLSVSLIPFLGIYGAVIGTTAAELFGLIFQMIICRKYINLINYAILSFPFAIIGFIMFCCIKIVSVFLDNGLYSLLLQIGMGGVIYCIMSYGYIRIFQKDIWNFLSFKKSGHNK